MPIAQMLLLDPPRTAYLDLELCRKRTSDRRNEILIDGLVMREQSVNISANHMHCQLGAPGDNITPSAQHQAHTGGLAHVILMRDAMLKKKHSRVEIAQKLAEASDLASQGKLQSEIAQTLGISVMTLHRWRKIPRDPASAEAAEVDQFEQESEDSRLEELRLENSRLRRLVTDLLLERMKLEDAARANRPSTKRGAQQFRRRDLIASYS